MLQNRAEKLKLNIKELIEEKPPLEGGVRKPMQVPPRFHNLVSTMAELEGVSVYRYLEDKVCTILAEEAVKLVDNT